MLMYNLLLLSEMLSWPRQVSPLLSPDAMFTLLYICYSSCSDPSWQPHQYAILNTNVEYYKYYTYTLYTYTILMQKVTQKYPFVYESNNPFTDLNIPYGQSSAKLPVILSFSHLVIRSLNHSINIIFNVVTN